MPQLIQAKPILVRHSFEDSFTIDGTWVGKISLPNHRGNAALQPIAVASYSREASGVRASGSGVNTWPDEMWERFVRGRVERMGPEPASYRRAQAAYYRESVPVADDHE